MKALRRRRGTAAIGALIALASIGQACAPMAVLRPPVPIGAGNQWERGMGAIGAIVLPARPTPACIAVNEWPVKACSDPAEAGAGVQGWIGRSWSDWFFPAILAYFGTNLFGLGLQARFLRGPAVLRYGLDLEAGFAWGSVGVPVAWQLAENRWIFARPAVSIRLAQGNDFINYLGWQLPIGAAWGLDGGSQLLFEAGLRAGAEAQLTDLEWGSLPGHASRPLSLSAGRQAVTLGVAWRSPW